MRIVIGADHAGFELKAQLRARLEADGHDVLDVGTSTPDPVDYPDIAAAVGRAVAGGEAERGIVVCGSGAGASIAAGKITGIRSATVHDVYSAHQSVEHDDMNVLALGSRVIGSEVAWEIARAFVEARFSGEERHLRRLHKVEELDRSRA
jgi:RpiB/LacA/LacB family sugar-phosphate isomerase